MYKTRIYLGIVGTALAVGSGAAFWVHAQSRPWPPAPGYIVQGAKLHAAKHLFTPDTLTFQAGPAITIVLSSIDGNHSFAIDGLDVRSEEAGKGESVVVDFVAEQPGRYEFYCAHGDHREKGMVGVLTVVRSP